MKSVGMIGIGLMGHGIAKHICLSGQYSFHFLNHRGNQPTDDLIALGAHATDDIEVLAGQLDILLLCVTGANDVESILFGRNGIADKLAAGSIVIDCSTGLPERTKTTAKKLQDRKIAFADAAMTRTPIEAEQGKLNLIVGASDTLFSDIRPLLQCFSEHIQHAGEAGSGQMLKLIHNYVSLGYASIMAEAAAHARLSGIEADRLIEALDAGGGQSVVLNRFAPYLMAQDESRLRFSLSNAAKDIGYYIQSCGKSPVSDALLDQLCQAIEDKGGQDSVLKLTDYLYHRRNPASSSEA